MMVLIFCWVYCAPLCLCFSRPPRPLSSFMRSASVNYLVGYFLFYLSFLCLVRVYFLFLSLPHPCLVVCTFVRLLSNTHCVSRLASSFVSHASQSCTPSFFARIPVSCIQITSPDGPLTINSKKTLVKLLALICSWSKTSYRRCKEAVVDVKQ